MMEHKQFACETKQISGRTVTGITAVMGNVDDGNDRIQNGAFKRTLKQRGDRIQHLWQHCYQDPPTATIKAIREVGKDELPPALLKKCPEATGGLEVTREYLNTPRGDEMLACLSSDPPAIKEMSIGFDPIDYKFDEEGTAGVKIRTLRECRLWDTSDVNWGMNSATVSMKSAVPYKETGTAKEDTKWSAPGLAGFTDEKWEDLDPAEQKRIANHFAWADGMPPEKFEGLKLPHHLPGKGGVGEANWKGVAAAMAALLGARGGTDIPDGDRKAVYDHLAKHYAEFGKEAPDFKTLNLVITCNQLLTDVEWNEKNQKVNALLVELKSLLIAPEPRPVAALTVMKRLEIAEHNLHYFGG
jgi:HK97 family phage prohead protease